MEHSGGACGRAGPGVQAGRRGEVRGTSLDVQGRANGAAERVLAADLPAGAEAVLVTQLELVIGYAAMCAGWTSRGEGEVLRPVQQGSSGWYRPGPRGGR